MHVQDERSAEHRSREQLAESDWLDREHLDKLCRALTLFGMQARPVVRHGLPFNETLKIANEEGVGLIVLGIRGRTAVQELLAGSTFENVARLSHQPVLVVRSGLAWACEVPALPYAGGHRGHEE